MKFAKFASAVAFGLCALGSVQAQQSTLSKCYDSTVTTSNAGYVSCLGSFEGSLNKDTVLPTSLGFSSGTFFNSGDFALATNPFSQDEGTNDDGVINFDFAQAGKFVLGLKQADAYSLYLFDGSLVVGGITSIKYNTLGIYTAPIGGSKMSHAGFFGTPVAAVPEPETYALMLAGLGLMGAIVRRRKAK
jgi:PEP-CTERM motif